ncbi:NADH-quinone oxidoreductase subunit NuoE [Sulfobacillus thermosulfidooxidans]|uniref:NADH dehydrogenase subunit E n=2 Tax=Sulfobacillus thermosulfidooxidans TaxID=28034 RepID=A0A1W1WGG6_SULTA|nr:NADH-quinone oxidoreductase subunit NuoE [Sulfobacillus thermosulfidooxidans]OLZ08686.1 NADH dehydrogenase [Sulfobacillus thermosulfidooxidans]OLZ17309.1 NADH dehydrogenase [Sulfobacillus thermosulfidooxidans]OLZ19374.1 NADH dehydrogenase [Sulfobacillus thermosulfidooxidans]PSR27264.1 MAG: NAD(P)H-dependent oxidoreductase subunit E [Sulfobacillus thermosulfidooxidans]SMC05282.1 NADH dehydrogenase subunit E [Sulfobacillus thermosulfidooxidans DSM 9293]
MKPEWIKWAEEAKEQFPEANSSLLPLLHRIQQAEGWLSDDTIADVASLLGLTTQYVESVASFYSLLYREKVGKNVIHVCVGLSCALAGADKVMEELEHKLGISEGQSTPDGEYTLLEAECLAACNLAPVVQRNLRYHGLVNTAEKLDALLTDDEKEVTS